MPMSGDNKRRAKWRRRTLVAWLIGPLLSGCAQGLPDYPGLRMAVSSDPAYDPLRPTYGDAITLGSVTTKFSLLRPDEADNFRAGLADSLEINHLLAPKPSAAKYRLDAEADFTETGIFERSGDTMVHYHLIAIGSNEVIFDDVIRAKNTQSPELYKKGGAVVCLLFCTRTEMGRSSEDAYDISVENNIRSFFDALLHHPLQHARPNDQSPGTRGAPADRAL
jgi:hypothetical protein